MAVLALCWQDPTGTHSKASAPKLLQKLKGRVLAGEKGDKPEPRHQRSSGLLPKAS